MQPARLPLQLLQLQEHDRLAASFAAQASLQPAAEGDAGFQLVVKRKGRGRRVAGSVAALPGRAAQASAAVALAQPQEVRHGMAWPAAVAAAQVYTAEWALCMQEACAPECVVCLCEEPEVLCIPCGHLALCAACAALVLRSREPALCPVCREQVAQTLAVRL